eukprot:11156048-Lingulodinium_polyedra.AAC.1
MQPGVPANTRSFNQAFTQVCIYSSMRSLTYAFTQVCVRSIMHLSNHAMRATREQVEDVIILQVDSFENKWRSS